MIRLTQLVECAGCAAKMDSAVLARVLGSMPAISDERILVDYSTADDAAVYRLTPDLAIVLTLDFFTPIVDDPRTFGRIAATNALSDVYAMGAVPIAALAISAFPESGLPESVLADIAAGGADAAADAGIAVIGGHTIKDPEPKYGLSVVGTVHPDRIVRNSTARVGDVLVLTKPLGTGILTTARRRGTIGDDGLAQAIQSMCALNRDGAAAMLAAGVSAATDVTGFGLLGHLREMTEASGVGAEIASSDVPAFAGAIDLAVSSAPGGTQVNLRNALDAGARFAADVSDAMKLLLADAQTSGGLLVSVPERRAQTLLAELTRRGVNRCAAIGRITSGNGIYIG